MDKYQISYYLLIIGIVILVINLALLLITYLKYNRSKDKNLTGYDIAKNIIDKNKIMDLNIIETKENKNNYNLKRRVIKLSTKTYNNYDYISLIISSYLASYAVLDDNKNSSINTLKKIFTNIGLLSISSILSIIISYLLAGYYAIIGIIILIIIFIYQYLRKNINDESINIINNNIEDRLKLNFKKLTNTISIWYNLSLIITILEICRMIIYFM